ncbi:hypothetical protein C8Q76DRAFT_4667 [Earliella scabrosa]|nr:hypothetical protein C8Q76DRAFT_4667 [Earliella scabrosa]
MGQDLDQFRAQKPSARSNPLTSPLLPTSSNPIIPWEVAEIIIDILDDDPSTILNVCLTARHLLPRGRLRLVRTVYAKTMTQCEMLCDFLDRYPRLKSFVATLVINATTAESTSRAPTVVPARLIRTLPNLHHWHISSPQRPYMSFHVGQLAFLKQYSAVQDLRIGPMALTSCAEFARFITSFPGLQHLQCTKISLQNPSTAHVNLTPNVRKRRPITLRSLVTGPEVDHDVIKLLLTISRETIEEFTYDYGKIVPSGEHTRWLRRS